MDLFDAVSFEACRQRLVWAKAKSDALVMEWHGLHQRNPSTVTFDPKGNREFDVMVESGIKAVPVEHSLVFGEVLYHIRAALDGAVYACVLESGPMDAEREQASKFMVGWKKKSFNDTMDAMKVSPDRRVILEAVQPYHTPTNELENTIAGYRPAFELLNRLAIVDRHHKVHVLGTILRSHNFKIIPPDGYKITFERLHNIVHLGNKAKIGDATVIGPETATPIQVHFDGELGIEVAIDQGTTDLLKGHMLIERINTIIECTGAMIEMLEKAKR